MDRTQLQGYLREKMPLAEAMDVQVLRVDDELIELGCLLGPNHNHLGTAFGGSLSALMILAAYCRLFHVMNEQGHVILKSCTSEFLKPVKEDLRAVCLPVATSAIEEFFRVYEKKGRARLSLVSEVRLSDGTVACRMTGEFVGVPV